MSRLLAAAAALLLVCAPVLAAEPDGQPKGKENGDGPDDLAPLARGGNFATKGPAGHENTPAVGGAMEGAGGTSTGTAQSQNASSAAANPPPNGKDPAGGH